MFKVNNKNTNDVVDVLCMKSLESNCRGASTTEPNMELIFAKIAAERYHFPKKGPSSMFNWFLCTPPNQPISYQCTLSLPYGFLMFSRRRERVHSERMG